MSSPKENITNTIEEAPTSPSSLPNRELGTYEHLAHTEASDLIESRQNDIMGYDEPREEGLDDFINEELDYDWSSLIASIYEQLIAYMTCPVCHEKPGDNINHQLPENIEAQINEVRDLIPEDTWMDVGEFLESLEDILQGIEQQYWEEVLIHGCEQSGEAGCPSGC